MNGQLQECVRGAIVTGICAQRTNREIADLNNISVNTVKSFARSITTSLKRGDKMKSLKSKGSSIGAAVTPTAWRLWRRCRRPSTMTWGGQ
jgi:hypothetical protein